MSLGWLMRPDFPLKTLQLQGVVISASPQQKSVLCSLPGLGITQTQKSRFLLPNTAAAQGRRRISAKARFSISPWRGNPFLFSSTLLGGQHVRAGQQLLPLREETATQKPFHQPTSELRPGPPTRTSAAPAARHPRPSSDTGDTGTWSRPRGPHF